MFDYRNKVFIAVLVFYSCTAILSAVRLVQHGFKRASSERILLVFSIGRILCAAFQLATINDIENTSLWAGYVTTFSICVSLLLSSSYVLLKRLAERAGSQFPKILGRDPMKLCQFVVTTGLILGIVGGTKTNEDWETTGYYKPDSLLQASIAIFLAAWLTTVFLTVVTVGKASFDMLRDERLAVVAFCVSLPLLLVRIIYSAISIFANPLSFSSIYGNVTIMLCMALLEEMIVVLIYEGVGAVTLSKDKRSLSNASDLEGSGGVEEVKNVRK